MIRSCDSCPYGGVKVQHRGPIDSDVVIVGDNPTPIELARKLAFTGPTNELLQKMLEQSGFTSSGVEPLYINALECFPRDKTTADKKGFNKAGEMKIIPGGKKKYAAALASCHNRLQDILRQHPRKLIITLGAGALHAVTGDKSLKINNERGGVIQNTLAEHGVFVIQHPTQLLKGGGALSQFKGDFVKAFEIYNGGKFVKYTEARYVTLDTPGKVRLLAKKLFKAGVVDVAADIEAGGFNFLEDEILELGVSLDGKLVYMVPGELIIPELFENSCRWTWHNGKFDIRFLWAIGCWAARVDEDTMLRSYALDSTKGRHGLEQVGWDHLGAPDYKDMLKPYLKNKQTSYREIPTDVRRRYAAIDVGLTYQLLAPLRKLMEKDPQICTAYTRILIPGSNYLARIEWNGFLTDREWVKRHKDEMETQLLEYQKEFQELALKSEGWNKEVNTNSPKQLQQYLYTHLQLAHPLQSTDRDTLETLPYHDCLEPLLKIRRLQKYLSTYVYPCWDNVDKEGRVHATYNIHGTKTGRLSSSGPNMQNIPRKQEVRGMFIAPEGRILVECDLSQAELRSLAQLSGDVELCRIFNSDELSLHDEVTKEIWPEYQTEGRNPVDDKELKMRGKAVNFGIVYGRQAPSFVAEFNITMQEASRWIARWLDRFPLARDYIKACRTAVDKGQTLQTIFGRKRKFGVITPERRGKLQNEASNFPHQSTASDITLLAGIRVEPILRLKYNAKIVNTVHDCIVIECDPVHKDAICKLVTGTMVAIPREWGLNRVPFESESEVGARWGHLKGYHDYTDETGAEDPAILADLLSMESTPGSGDLQHYHAPGPYCP